jgi:hypothetical protein
MKYSALAAFLPLLVFGCGREEPQQQAPTEAEPAAQQVETSQAVSIADREAAVLRTPPQRRVFRRVTSTYRLFARRVYLR